MPLSALRMMAGAGAGIAHPQRGKQPPVATVLAVILADDGAAPIDAVKLASVLQWCASRSSGMHLEISLVEAITDHQESDTHYVSSYPLVEKMLLNFPSTR